MPTLTLLDAHREHVAPTHMLSRAHHAVPEAGVPMPDARRLLEVLVPLVYRPALKAAMLQLPMVSSLARLLGEMVLCCCQ